MTDEQAEPRPLYQRSRDLAGQALQHARPHGLRTGFIGEKRAAQFDEDKFGHAITDLGRTGEPR